MIACMGKTPIIWKNLDLPPPPPYSEKNHRRESQTRELVQSRTIVWFVIFKREFRSCTIARVFRDLREAPEFYVLSRFPVRFLEPRPFPLYAASRVVARLPNRLADIPSSRKNIHSIRRYTLSFSFSCAQFTRTPRVYAGRRYIVRKVSVFRRT